MRISLLSLLILSGCAYTPPGKLSADAFIYVDKQANGILNGDNSITISEQAYREAQAGEVWGIIKNAFFNVLMLPIDFIWTGRILCHAPLWKNYEEGHISC